MKRVFAAILSLVLLISLATAALGAEPKVKRSTQALTVDGAARGHGLPLRCGV